MHTRWRWWEARTSSSRTAGDAPGPASTSRSPERARPTTAWSASNWAYCSNVSFICEKEGAPITEDFGIDLLTIPTAPWPRFGVEGAIAHLKGRGDFVSIFVLDLAGGASSEPQRHLFEEVVYVLSGHGSTTVEASDDGDEGDEHDVLR